MDEVDEFNGEEETPEHEDSWVEDINEFRKSQSKQIIACEKALYKYPNNHIGVVNAHDLFYYYVGVERHKTRARMLRDFHRRGILSWIPDGGSIFIIHKDRIKEILNGG